jgi:dTMP kinase
MDGGGKFIVIEGTDGSGKTAQFERLILALPENVKIATMDFPRYGEPSSYFIQKYLTGKYGGEVGPYAAATFFAMDRFDAKLKMLQALEDGRLLLANRYVASNMAYQGAKFANRRDREEFYKWLHFLEYEQYEIPKPDLNIVLHVPAEIARALIARKPAREYLEGGVQDIHEIDLEHQKRAEQVYLEIAALFPNEFTVIECAPDGKLLSVEKVHELVWAAAKKFI